MNKAIRMAIAAGFGVATVLPALAQQQERVPQDRYYTYDVPQDRYYNYDSRGMIDSSNEFGSPAGNMASDREIHLGANPGSIGVNHNETVKFVTADGREFRWRFDTAKRITSFPLANIAPDRNLSGRVF